MRATAGVKLSCRRGWSRARGWCAGSGRCAPSSRARSRRCRPNRAGSRPVNRRSVADPRDRVPARGTCRLCQRAILAACRGRRRPVGKAARSAGHRARARGDRAAPHVAHELTARRCRCTSTSRSLQISPRETTCRRRTSDAVARVSLATSDAIDCTRFNCTRGIREAAGLHEREQIRRRARAEAIYGAPPRRDHLERELARPMISRPTSTSLRSPRTRTPGAAHHQHSRRCRARARRSRGGAARSARSLLRELDRLARRSRFADGRELLDHVEHCSAKFARRTRACLVRSDLRTAPRHCVVPLHRLVLDAVGWYEPRHGHEKGRLDLARRPARLRGTRRPSTCSHTRCTTASARSRESEPTSEPTAERRSSACASTCSG